ncbi:hypothetical protein LCGC14_1954310, partial [marine sediment metagenome]
MSSLLEAALAYLDRGWSVIPCVPRGKKPLIEWGGDDNRLPTRKQVRSWWEKWPNANIAIVTGAISGIVVADVDVDRGAKPEDVAGRTPTGFVVQTGGGGWHFYYAYPPGLDRIPNKVGSDGIDIRADGGYVIAPPSIHASGELYSSVKEGDLALCPSWITSPVKPDDDSGSSEPGWISRLLKGIDRGGRNDACAKLAGYYAGKRIPKDITLEMMFQWNKNNKPPLPRHEISTTVNSVFKTDSNRRARKPGYTNGKTEGESGRFNLVSLDEYMHVYGDKEVSWTIDEWFPDETIAFA